MFTIGLNKEIQIEKMDTNDLWIILYISVLSIPYILIFLSTYFYIKKYLKTRLSCVFFILISLICLSIYFAVLALIGVKMQNNLGDIIGAASFVTVIYNSFLIIAVFLYAIYLRIKMGKSNKLPK